MDYFSQIQTFEQAVGFVKSKEKFGSMPGLERIGALCDCLGNPQKDLRVIHVAGTNGKGSTTMFISNILMAAGHKVGTFISPSVNSFGERIMLNGAPISEADFVMCTNMAAKALAEAKLEVTEFELITAIMFLYFARERCDFVVLEVGMGGRYDSTNVVGTPDVAVITSIDIDHTEYLGDSVGEIAYEKAGIIKRGGNVVIYSEQPREAVEVIERVAAEVGARVFCTALPEIISHGIEGVEFIYEGERFGIKMLGRHQALNAALAVNAVRRIPNFKVSSEQIREGLLNTHFAGRFEIVCHRPLVILDGAHNCSAALMLADALREYVPAKELAFVFGMLADKEYEKCIATLAPLASKFIVTVPPNLRAADAEVLADIARRFCDNVEVIPDRFEAAEAALRGAQAVCICGSLYLIGGLRDYVVNCLSKKLDLE